MGYIDGTAPALMTGTPLVLVEAPGGYGKTVACAQFAAALEVATARVTPSGPVDLPGLLSAPAAERVGLARAALARVTGELLPRRGVGG